MNKNTNQKSRKGTLQLLAIVTASIVAGTSVFAYTSTVTSNARDEQKLVNVYLAQKQIPIGTSLGTAIENGFIQVEEFPVGVRPADSIFSVNAANANLVARQTIQAGQIITTPLFAVTAANTGALTIPEGMLAITVPMEDPAKVGSFLQPGSEVVVYVTGSIQGDNKQSTQVLLPRVTVLAVGDQVSSSGSSSTSAPLITLALPPTQAKKLIFASKTMSLYFGLRTDGVEVSGTSAVNSSNLLAAKN